jgi:tetratricopeptide (TPR) repeat protein
MYYRLQPYVLQAAIDKLERALELLPEDSDAWYSLGVLLSDQGRKEEAVAAYTRSVTINAGRRARSALAAPWAAPRLAASASVAWSAAQLAAHGFGPGLLYAL